MRTLTSIQSDTSILTQIELEVTASDASTTFCFSHGDLVNMPTISWDIDFLGGLGKTSNYNITLSSSIDFFKDNFKKFVNAETRLNVITNSDQYQIHVGRVRDLVRNSKDPNLMNITVYDSFLQKNPKFPIETLVESYTTLHPEITRIDYGYPLYYGKHVRPFFHTAVDSDISELIGPFDRDWET